MSSSADVAATPEGVRQRHAVQFDSPQDASRPRSAESEREDAPKEEAKGDKKAYGRTPDGTIFVVPTTHDMVSQLLDPRQPKNMSDGIVIAVLAVHILVAWLLPAALKMPVCALIFVFWRASYNVGIGYLLRVQSHHRLLQTWVKKCHLFDHPSSGTNPRPWLYNLLRREFETKIAEDYEFDKAPLEYNTWLVFRRVVDLILMCDFVSYCLFAITCAHKPEGEVFLMTIARWALGVSLFMFNLWVKLDAHRVVKDFAWYWGDFFFLMEGELTFDGVFEMAPHPMYSIGYAGYYGISAMAASYPVLFISIAAHVAQLIFLVVVENPHIDKTYNPPPPRMRTDSMHSRDASQDMGSEKMEPLKRDTPTPVHDLLGATNVDLFRITDYSVILLVSYLFVFTFMTPSTPAYQILFVAHALMWRLWYSIGLGVILSLQSKEKMFTRHFVKYGDSAAEAWRQWKGMYHFSMALCHASFMVACWKLYALPADWSDGWIMLRHVLGTSLMALHLWTAVSIYDELGEFGWFFGDFFFDARGKLTYNSIYRFLNNPERVIGTAGFWGAALITWSKSIFLLALFAHVLTIGFLEYVEKPHMQKVYGRTLREEAGLTRFIKKSLPPPVKGWTKSVDKVLDETRNFVDEFVEAARPKLASGVSTIVRDTTALFNKYPARLTITKLSPDLAGFDPKHYSLSVEGTRLSDAATQERFPGKESLRARIPKAVKTLTFEYGAPIRVRWTAPANHAKKDWVGLYMVTDNRTREYTEVSSLGRWVPTCRGQYDTATDEGIVATDKPVAQSPGSDVDLVQGEMMFEGDKLWWSQGVFEFRYHHSTGHHVMSVSEPFKIRIGSFDEEDVFGAEEDGPGLTGGALYERAVETALLPVLRNCFDRDPEIAPETVEEPFGSLVERDGKFARRITYAIYHMFGIEFAPAVVPADGSVRKLAWRICNAKQVLAPYSMSHSKGTSTPIPEKHEVLT